MNNANKNKPNSNPIQTQYKPNTNPIKANTNPKQTRSNPTCSELVEPISKARKCVSLVNVADLNNDNSVNYMDMMLFTDKWPFEEVLLAEDLNRDGFVDFTDFAIFADNWHWEQ